MRGIYPNPKGFRSDGETVKLVAMIAFAVALLSFSIWANIAYRKWVVREAVKEVLREEGADALKRLQQP